MKYFKTHDERAAAYAAYKALDKMLGADGDLPAGYRQDFSGKSVTIILPENTIVEREIGFSRNGTIEKKAVQNLYGYTFWVILIGRLKKFNQWKAIRAIILEALNESLKNLSKTKDEIEKKHPDIVQEIKDFQNEVVIPKREEKTPRMVYFPKKPAFKVEVS